VGFFARDELSKKPGFDEVSRIGIDKSAFGKLAVSRPEFDYFRHVTDRRSEKKLGLKLALMGEEHWRSGAQSGGQFQLQLSRSESLGGIFTEVGTHELVHKPRLLMCSQDQARLEAQSGIGEWLHDHALLGASIQHCRFRQDRNAHVLCYQIKSLLCCEDPVNILGLNFLTLCRLKDRIAQKRMNLLREKNPCVLR
jgi:hypothetical protein